MKMKRLVRNMAMSALAAVSVASVFTPAVKAEEPTTITMYQIGTPPDNLDQLLAKVNEAFVRDLNLKLEIRYLGWGEYDDKMNVMTNSGEKYDIARASGYIQNASKGAYADLTDLIKEHAQDSFKYLDEAYIKGNTVDGKMYAFPVNGNVYAQEFYTFNPTFLKKYNLKLDGIKELKDVEPLLQTIKDKEPSVAPLAAGRGWRVGHDFDYVIGDAVPLGVYLKGDTAKIVNPYEETDAFIPEIKVMHEFYKKGFVPKDAATSDQGYPLDADTWFMRRETVGPRDYGNYLLRAVSGKALEIVPHGDTIIKTNAQARMSNFVIAQNSDHVEESVKLLNYINSKPEIMNTLVYGLEGENWEKVGEDKIKLLPKYNEGATHMSAWNTGNAALLYKDERITPEQLAASEKGLKEATESPLLGFNFNQEPVADEIANVNNVVNEYVAGLHTGTVDPEKVLPEFNKALKDAGIDKIKEEMQRQYDEFLKNKN